MVMKMQILRIIIALAFGVTLAFAQDKISHPYYPLSVGTEWQYNFNYAEGMVYRTVEKTIGDTLFYIKDRVSFGSVLATIDWEKLVIRKNGIYRVAFKGMDDPEYNEKNPPELVLPLPMEIGFKWEHGIHKYEITEHHRDVTVTTKTYEDCYIIESLNSRSNLKERYFYARNLGLVLISMKSQSPGNNWDWVLAITESTP